MSSAEYTAMMLNHLVNNPPTRKDLAMKKDPTKKTKRQVDFRTKQGDVGIRAF